MVVATVKEWKEGTPVTVLRRELKLIPIFVLKMQVIDLHHTMWTALPTSVHAVSSCQHYVRQPHRRRRT